MTEIATTEEAIASTELEILPPARPVVADAISTLHQHVDAMQSAKFFAEGMCYTQMVPQRFQGKPDDGAAAILFGAELGLSPIASLRSIIVIHGMPGMEARTMKALLKTKGYRFNTIEASDTAFEIEAWSPDGRDHETSRWTIEDCQREGWVPTPTANSQQRPEVKADWVCTERNGKTSVVGNMKYITSPRTMLKAKATAEVCRDIAPHILLGMPYAAEELESFDDVEPVAPTARRKPTKARGVAALTQRVANDVQADAAVVAAQERLDKARRNAAQRSAEAEPAAPEANPATGGMSAQTRKKWQARMFVLLGEADCNDRDDQIAVIEELSGRTGLEHRDGLTDDELRVVVNLLNDESKAGNIGQFVTNLLNTVALRASGYAETADTTTTEGN